MSSIAIPHTRLGIRVSGERTLTVATHVWFVVTLISQVIFGFSVASFYGLSAARGDYHRWARFISGGYIQGDTMGNLAIAMHVGSAAVIMLAGALQLVPGLRIRFPRFHRWNGRVYMMTALAGSAAGVYMTYFRRSVGDVWQHIGSSLDAVLIWGFAVMALRTALARDFGSHRRWALRLFIAVSATWFLRITFFLMLATIGPVGFDPTTFSGPMLTSLTYAQYIVPLAILELYFFAKRNGTTMRRMATAGVLFVSTAVMIAGTVTISMAIWIPDAKAGFDTRVSIAETLSATIDSRGVDAAVARYHALKSTKPTLYDFEERELNSLGYRLLRANHVKEAIRVFELNIEAYPKSSNVYDSLGEAYLKSGDKALAIANYRRSLELNPKNAGAETVLRKLDAAPRAKGRGSLQ